MNLIGSSFQGGASPLYDASGTIASGGTAQLVLARSLCRSFFLFQNISDTTMFVDFGSARGTATLTSGVVSSVSVTNAGQGFTYAPRILFLGGGPIPSAQSLNAGQVGYPAPSNPASATCVMSGSAGALIVASVSVDNGGSGYVKAPYVFFYNDPNDPFGVATPSATVGIQMPANMTVPFILNGSFCTTDAVAVYCATTSKAFVCKYAP